MTMHGGDNQPPPPTPKSFTLGVATRDTTAASTNHDETAGIGEQHGFVGDSSYFLNFFFDRYCSQPIGESTIAK